MKILFVADIVGEPGRELVRRLLPVLNDTEHPDLVIANAENAAGGKGITPPIIAELLQAGVHVITLGNHTFDRKEAESALTNERVLRPLNYPAGVPGQGVCVTTTALGVPVAVINLMGRVYMPLTDDPFASVNTALAALTGKAQVIIVDFHAEITSEKVAMGWFLDGRVAAVIGTHTHIPTADEAVLPGGTAYITDAGMSGPMDGVIGMNRDLVLKKYLTGIPQHFAVAPGRTALQGCVIDVDEETGRARSIRRITLS